LFCHWLRFWIEKKSRANHTGKKVRAIGVIGSEHQVETKVKKTIFGSYEEGIHQLYFAYPVFSRIFFSPGAK